MRTTTLLLLILFLSGCDRFSDYELSKSDAGRVYRLNKRSGEVSVIEGYNLTILQEPTEQASKAKSWPTVTLPSVDSVQLSLRTAWREGKLYYILSASPYKGKLKTAKESYLSSSSLTIQMTDANGFYLLTIPVPLSSMTRIVDNNGEPLYISANEKILCTSETYLALSSWTCSWNF